MIIIAESGTSSAVFRLNKVSQYTNPYYIFKLENQNSKEITLFTGDDISNYPLYYNEFIFVNGVTYSSTQSSFNLDSGMYFLDVYETPYQYNLTIASASLIHSGEMKIEGTLVPNTQYYSGGDLDTTVYFE